jgi:hypothetical protein
MMRLLKRPIQPAGPPAIAERLGWWLALVSAVLLRPFYTLPEGAFLQALVLLAAAALLLAAGPLPKRRPWWRSAVLPGALAFLAALHPPAWWPALTALAMGVLLEPLPWIWPSRIAAGLRRAGLALYAGLWLVPAGSALQAMFDADRVTGWLAEGLGRLAGLPVAGLVNDLVLQTPDEALPFSLAPEWTGFWPRLLALGVLLAGLLRRPRQGLGDWAALAGRTGLFLLLAHLWAALVFLSQSLLAAMHAQYEAPWSPLLQIALGLPAALLAALLAGPAGDTPAPAATTGHRRPALAWVLSLGAWILLLAGLVLQDPGLRKPGRVVIDDGHSDWEWAGEAMNSWQFGTKTTYNYHGLGRLLSRHYETTILVDPITAELLDSVDVLILKTPTRPYSAAERAAVLAWVEAGGGLYLISDHTDVFGMSTFLNELALEFGFEFNKDTVFDLLSTRDQFWPGPEGPLRHPAITHLPFYRYLTGCSIRPSPRCEVLMTGPQTGSDLLSYATGNFFDTWYPRTELRFGSLVQLVAAKHGRGRVIGFSDSTTYSNFAMFLPGRLEHLIGIVEWLNRRNAALPWRLLLLLGALALAWAANRQGAGGERLSAAVLAWALVLPAAQAWTTGTHPWPGIRSPLPTCSLDTALSQARLPVTGSLEPGEPLDFETFFVWLHRSGRLPELSDTGPTAHSELHAVINPSRLPTLVEQARLEAFLQRGGTLLVAGQPGRIVNGINGWLDRYGAGFVAASWRDTTVQAAGGGLAVFVDAVQGVKGGRPLYSLPGGTPVAVEQPVGAGRLIVSGLASCFTTNKLGRYDSVPGGLAYEYLHIYYRHVDIQGLRHSEQAGDIPQDGGW